LGETGTLGRDRCVGGDRYIEVTGTLGV